MREDFWSYEPTHKLFIAGNHKPLVRGDDEGIWRRMRLVPWLVTIAENEQDKTLAEKLMAEAPGILGWAVRGCTDWLRDGLGEPDAVRRATKTYREENDALGEFFRLQVVFAPEATVTRKELRERYEAFCKECGEQPFGAKRFAGRLRERGVAERKVRTGSGSRDGWAGVRLATDAEQATVQAWGSRGDVVTCGEGERDSGVNTPLDLTNRELVATGHHVTTDDQSDFADYLAREGIGGGK
jgi:putative DNA primase/helicase